MLLQNRHERRMRRMEMRMQREAMFHDMMHHHGHHHHHGHRHHHGHHHHHGIGTIGAAVATAAVGGAMLGAAASHAGGRVATSPVQVVVPPPVVSGQPVGPAPVAVPNRTVVIRSVGAGSAMTAVQNVAPAAPQSAPLAEGWLIKQAVSASAWWKNWRRRWLALYPDHLEWREHPSAPASGAIPIGASTLLAASNAREHTFSVSYAGRELLLQASSEMERRGWYDSVERAISNQRGVALAPRPTVASQTATAVPVSVDTQPCAQPAATPPVAVAREAACPGLYPTATAYASQYPPA